MAKYEVKDGVGIIPEWATEIEAEAFKYCEELKSVVIPQWVRKIGSYAFSGCSFLTSISIPPSVREIGEGAFRDCSSLSTVKVSKDTMIGGEAFKNCPNVQIEWY